ncbi:MAG: hypothetical protein RLZ98_3532 [Pseudomonadota bacterium]|jgi:hypothetical protein
MHNLTRLLALLFLTVFCGQASARDTDAFASLVKREILALYDATQEPDAAATRIHRFAETPLNHLGYIVKYMDIARGVPPVSELHRYAGVITWFVGAVPYGDDYLRWATQASRSGARFLVLGEVGVPVGPANLQLANAFLSSLGVRHTGMAVWPTDGSRVVMRDRHLYEFECRLDPLLPAYPVLEPASPASRGVLTVATPGHAGGRNAQLVSIGPGGGFAAFNYEFCHQSPPLHKGRWLVDPFRFFNAALSTRRFPVPDVTTHSGRRIYFSIVSSDGWAVTVDGSGRRSAKELASEFVIGKLIAPYPDLPVTIDLHERDFDTRGLYRDRANKVAAGLASMGHVSRPGRIAVGSKVTRFDSSHDSVSNLAPITSPGKAFTVMTATSSLRAYATTDGYSPSRFYSLRETLQRTENPRRLRAANVNFSTRIATDEAMVNVLRGHLDYMHKANVAGMSANQYAEIVEGFHSARIRQVGTRAWRIEKRGSLQTVRFDDAAGERVDMRRSIGVLGYTRHAGSLYVSLDAASQPAVVALVEAAGADAGHVVPILSESRWSVRSLRRSGNDVSFEARGFGAGEFAWQVAPSTRWRIAASRGGRALWQSSATADAGGRLVFVVPLAAIEPLQLKLLSGS